MNVGHRSARPLAHLLRPLQHTRAFPLRYSTTAAELTVEASEDIDPVLARNIESAEKYRVNSSVVVSRPPMITRDLGEFEQSFYFYQRRLNERLSLPFTRYFYFKKGSLQEAEYKRKQAQIEKYNPYGERGWADELMIGDDRHKSEDNGYQFLVDTTVTGEESNTGTDVEGTSSQVPQDGAEVGQVKRQSEKPLPRISKADLENDTRSLDRKMSRTLYLLVKRNKGPWFFPESRLVGTENLHQAAERTLREAAGVNMNTWFVGHVPIGHYVTKYPENFKDEDYVGQKFFFMKARIMVGQADLKGNLQGLEDFQWLTKEEIEKVVARKYFHAVKNMLVDR
ncbi:hypothetical protein RUND412_005433 [Rhizina undulata]